MRNASHWIALFLLLACFLVGKASHAAGMLDFNLIDPNNLGGVVPQAVADEAIRMFATYTVHRPYSGASSITGSNTLDFNFEATLVKIGDGILKAFRDNGISTAGLTMPAVPIVKINIRRGFGDHFDIGFSGLTYRGQSIFGGDLKFVLHDPEEGPTWALRFGYTWANVPYAYLKNISTLSPELVVSRRLTFAEPYLGIGGRYFRGTIDVPFHVTTPIDYNFNVTKSGSGFDGYAFTGVYFRILGATGLRMGIEGSFSIAGYHTVGGTFGFGF